ncbi:hypothetical protein D9M68_459140 [compost metagenome]
MNRPNDRLLAVSLRSPCLRTPPLWAGPGRGASGLAGFEPIHRSANPALCPPTPTSTRGAGLNLYEKGGISMLQSLLAHIGRLAVSSTCTMQQRARAAYVEVRHV